MTHSEKLKRIEMLMASPDVIELDALSAEVEAFERKAYPIAKPTLAEAIKFRREQRMETQKEISATVGISLKRWRLLESGQIEPSMKDARRLHSVGVPASVILGQNAEL